MRPLLIALALLAMAAAGAYSITDTCPLDGETAYFYGAKLAQGGGETCNYQHQHYDASTNRTVNHSYWIRCSSN